MEIEPDMVPEEAQSKLLAMGVPQYVFETLDVGSAKDKVDVISAIQNDHVDLLLSDLDLFLVVLRRNTKEFKDSNLQLNKALFNFLAFVD